MNKGQACIKHGPPMFVSFHIFPVHHMSHQCHHHPMQNTYNGYRTCPPWLIPSPPMRNWGKGWSQGQRHTRRFESRTLYIHTHCVFVYLYMIYICVCACTAPCIYIYPLFGYTILYSVNLMCKQYISLPPGWDVTHLCPLTASKSLRAPCHNRCRLHKRPERSTARRKIDGNVDIDININAHIYIYTYTCIYI